MQSKKMGRNRSHCLWLNERRFTHKKAKRKPARAPKQKTPRLQWAQEEQSWNVADYNKVMAMTKQRVLKLFLKGTFHTSLFNVSLMDFLPPSGSIERPHL